VWANDAYCSVDPQIETAIQSVAASLEANGAIVDDAARPVGFDFAKADLTFWNLLGGALSGSWSVDEIEVMAQQVASGQDVAGDLGVHGATLRHRLQMRARWREFFGSWDVLLAPVSPTAAIPHDHTSPQSQRTINVAGQQRSYLDQMRWMGLFGLAYLPVTCVPVGMLDGKLPIGMQIAGPFLEDRTTLAVAEWVEEITGGTRRPTGL
jgi:amidase